MKPEFVGKAHDNSDYTIVIAVMHRLKRLKIG